MKRHQNLGTLAAKFYRTDFLMLNIKQHKKPTLRVAKDDSSSEKVIKKYLSNGGAR